MISTWYQSACSKRNPDLRSIAVDRKSIQSVGDLIIFITNKQNSKDIFQGNKCTKAKLGFCSFMELYSGYKRDKNVHMQVSLDRGTYTEVAISIGVYIHGFQRLKSHTSPYSSIHGAVFSNMLFLGKFIKS